MQTGRQTLILPQDVAEIDAACLRSGIPGNNGGDAFVAAQALGQAGGRVSLHQLRLAPPAGEDAARAHAACTVTPRPLETYVPRHGDVVIDGVFGAGLTRDLPPALIDCVGTVTEAGLPVIAIDLPSGIDGRTGQVLGAAFHAAVTVTFMALKPGMLLLPGRDYCGDVEIADIGVPQRLIEAHRSGIMVNMPEIWATLRGSLGAGAHKYSRGALVVFSGGASHTGAARLSADAGLRAGAGLVTVASPGSAMAANAAHLTAVMLKRIDDAEALRNWLEDARLGAFVLGPGFGVGEKARDFALALKDRRLVLDADGISSFRDDPERLFDAFAGEPRLVLTPHEGEFARLFADIAADRGLSKVEKALAAARRSNAAVIYKGSDTVIASPDGRVAINTNAPPSLATAGSGDVLAGICGALLAQAYPAYEAACAAVWHHGEAGRRAGRSLTAETLVAAIDI
jgi:NAD(P)H-hydrate epimerase